MIRENGINRISIIGPSAVGKTTFAKKLSKTCGIPLYHTDRILFGQQSSLSKARQRASGSEYEEAIQNIASMERFIIEGNMKTPAELSVLFDHCNLIIFLGISKHARVFGLLARGFGFLFLDTIRKVFRKRDRKNDEEMGVCRYISKTLGDARKITQAHDRQIIKYSEAVCAAEAYGVEYVIVLKSFRQINAFLRNENRRRL